MTEDLDAPTLLSASDVRHIVQFALNPVYIYSGSNESKNSSESNRAFCLHFYTGRPPTAGELSLHQVLDRLGDSHQDRPLTMRDRYLGGFTIHMTHTSGSDAYYQAGTFVQMQAASFYKNIKLPPMSSGFIYMPQLSRSHPDTLLEWRFRNSSTYWIDSDGHSRYGNRSFMATQLDAGKLVHAGRPTWFCISFDERPPHYYGVFDFDYNRAYRPKEITDPSGRPVAAIDRLLDAVEISPVMMGTVGAVGSGEDLELVDYDASGLARVLRLTTFRVVAEPVHE